MFLLEKNNILNIYDISTSKNPPSCKIDSFGTPTGLHQVFEKIGNNVEEGMVFKNRKPLGYTFPNAPEGEKNKNLITSRIIRLKGLDPKINLNGSNDTFKRYIYIHGTNKEYNIGNPFSKGCIELRNECIIDLFNKINLFDLIWIN